MLPNITVLIPTFNEQDFIQNCVESLICDSYPQDKIETLIIDGGSTDKTRLIIESLSGSYDNIKLIKNKNKTVPYAMNLGIKSASHSIIVWCGSHAVYKADYLKNSVEILLSEENCASVGGVITPSANTFTGQVIATATSHKFGIGNAQYRYATQRKDVDTVFGGCFLKSSVETIGGFNENWDRNQDYEFNYRLRKHVGNIILDPSIKCNYYCRESISELAKQYFSYGQWRFKTVEQHPKSISFRQLAPIILIIGLLISVLMLLMGSGLGLLVPVSYGLVNLLVSMVAVLGDSNFPELNNKKPAFYFLLATSFATIHLSWGCGFLMNLMKSAFKPLATPKAS